MEKHRKEHLKRRSRSEGRAACAKNCATFEGCLETPIKTGQNSILTNRINTFVSVYETA